MPAHPATPWPAEVRETHLSTVFLTGERACKVLKPVALGFVDQSTLDLRRRACHVEVEVNRRFAPDVYLGVVTLLDPDGAPCEHGILMRRLPDDRRLAALLDGDDAADHVRAVAHRVATIHGRAPTSPAITGAGSRAAVTHLWDANLAEMAPFAGRLLDAGAFDRTAELAHRYLAGRGELFGARMDGGCIRDGHGDLLAEDIFCLADGPRILDALAFDPSLRYGDVLLDAAFLAMDLEARGHAELATSFLDWYRELSGDTFPATLAHHYVAYRAWVRTKIACIRADQGDAVSAATARQLHALALDHLHAGRVRLVLVGGLPATGKSTVCDAVADADDWTVLRSDEVRKELAGLPHDSVARAAPDEELYRPELRAATYRELLRRARSLLERGERVLLDATWADGDGRAAAAVVARDTSADLVAFRCVAPLDLTIERLETRLPAGAHASDATPGIATAMATRFAPWPEATDLPTTAPIETTLAAALAELQD